MMVRGPRTFFGKTPFITFWVSSMFIAGKIQKSMQHQSHWHHLSGDGNVTDHARSRCRDAVMLFDLGVLHYALDPRRISRLWTNRRE
jgi:hypothetical protein